MELRILGRLAQLEERLLDAQEAVGSSPTSPTCLSVSKEILNETVRPKQLVRLLNETVSIIAAIVFGEDSEIPQYLTTGNQKFEAVILIINP